MSSSESIAVQVERWKKENLDNLVTCPIFKGTFSKAQCKENQGRLLHDSIQADGETSYSDYCDAKIKACRRCRHHVKGTQPIAPQKRNNRPVLG